MYLFDSISHWICEYDSEQHPRSFCNIRQQLPKHDLVDLQYFEVTAGPQQTRSWNRDPNPEIRPVLNMLIPDIFIPFQA